jgi:hypothetical protein
MNLLIFIQFLLIAPQVGQENLAPTFPIGRRIATDPIKFKRDGVFSFVYNDKSHSVWLATDSTFTYVDLNSGIKKDFKNPLFGEVVYYLWNEKDHSMLLWDHQVGRVWRWNPFENMVKRLDNSFKHMNQAGHAALVLKDNDIYAYGGYGLWTYKNFMTKFDTTSREWHLLEMKNQRNAPHLVNGYAFLDAGKNQYCIIGGYRHPYYVQGKNENIAPSQVLHRFRFADFEYVDSLSLRAVNANVKDLVTVGSLNVDFSQSPLFSPSSGYLFIFGLTGLTNNIDRETRRLTLVNVESGDYYVPEMPKVEESDAFRLVAVAWNEQKQQLIAGYINMASNSLTQDLIFYEYPMGDYLKQLDGYISEQTMPVWQKAFRWLKQYGAFGLVGFILVVVFVMLFHRVKRARENQISLVPEIESNQKIYALPTLVIEKTPAVFLRDQNLLHDFSDQQKTLLAAFLLAKTLNGGGIESDEIDEILEQGRMTQEYLRKMRSLHFQKINAFFKTQFSVVEAIERTHSETDKRRLVYRLSDVAFSKIALDEQEINIPAHWQTKMLFKRLLANLPPADERRKWFVKM